MGYYFALLLTITRSLKGRQDDIASKIDELIRLITSILHLATQTTDERTQYLTDNIYHIVVFSALTLCRVLQRYNDQLQQSHDISALDSLVHETVIWLTSIGLSSHVTHFLALVLDAQHKRSRPQLQEQHNFNIEFASPDFADAMLAYPDYLNPEAYDFDNTSEDWSSWNGFG